MKKVTVLGDGAWGTAIAMLLADNGHDVMLWCQNPAVADAIANTRMNALFLPGISLHPSIKVTTDLQAALQARYIFQAIPVKYLRSVLEKAHHYFNRDQIWISLSKGIEQNRLLLPSQILDDVFATGVQKVVISGPSFAKDLVQRHLTGVVIAAEKKDEQVLEDVIALMSNDYFVMKRSDDLIGVQLCGALKNCAALGVGILEGAGYSDNTKALLVTQFMAEMERLVIALGGDLKTISGLAGIGDCMLTAYGKQSKNMTYGISLGRQQAHQLPELPEGCNTIAATQQLAHRYGLTLPLCAALYEIVINGADVKLLIEQLRNY